MSRVSYIKDPEKIEVRIDSVSGGSYLIAFLSIWLIGWAIGWCLALYELLTDSLGFDYFFILVWFVGWSFGGFFFGLMYLWKLKGFEKISVNTSELVIKYDIFGFGPEKRYSVFDCRNIRAAGYFGKGQELTLRSQLGMEGGVVAFDVSSKVVRFGVDLEEQEAIEIVNELKGYLKK